MFLFKKIMAKISGDEPSIVHENVSYIDFPKGSLFSENESNIKLLTVSDTKIKAYDNKLANYIINRYNENVNSKSIGIIYYFGEIKDEKEEDINKFMKKIIDYNKKKEKKRQILVYNIKNADFLKNIENLKSDDFSFVFYNNQETNKSSNSTNILNICFENLTE